MNRMQKLSEMHTLLASIAGKMPDLGRDLEKVAAYIKKGTLIGRDAFLGVTANLQEIGAMDARFRELYEELEMAPFAEGKIGDLKERIAGEIRIQKRKEALVKCRKFLLLLARDERSAQLLEQKQKELKALLEEPDPGREKELEFYAQFVEAVLEEDSTKLMDYAFALSDFFGRELMGKTVIAKTVYLPEDAAAAALEEDAIEERTVEEKSKTASRMPEREENEEALQTPEDGKGQSLSLVPEKEENEDPLQAPESREGLSLSQIPEKEENEESLQALENGESQGLSQIPEKEKNKEPLQTPESGECRTVSVTLEKGRDENHFPVTENKNTQEKENIGNSEDEESSCGAGEEEDELRLVREITAGDLLLKDTSAAGELYFKRSPREGRKFGVKEFINDVRARYESLNVLALKNAYTFDAVVPKSLALETKKTEEEAALSLEYLQKKGYLREYGTDKLGAFYCLSQNGEKAFLAKEARAFLKPRGLRRLGAGEFAENIYSVLVRAAHIRLMSMFFEYLSEESKYQSFLLTECFASLFELSEDGKTCLLLGAFWDTAKEAGALIQKIQEKELKNCAGVMVAGLDKEHARKSAEFFITKFGFSPADTFCYGMLEEEFISYKTGETTELEAIWEGWKKKDREETEPGENRKDESEIDAKKAEPMTETAEQAVESEKETAEVFANAYHLILEGKFYCATTYLRSVMEGQEEIRNCYRKLGYALNVPWMKCSYNSRDIFTMYSDRADVFSDYLMVAAALRNFFMNHVSFDYDMKALHMNINEIPIVSENHPLTGIFYDLLSFKKDTHKGIDFYADYRDKDRVFVEREMGKVVLEAKSYYESYVSKHIKENASHKRYIETKKRIFAQDGDFARYLKVVVEGDRDGAELVGIYLQKYFLREECPVDDVNIDFAKLNAFVDYYWDKAAESMREARKSSDLMSRLRHNLLNAIEKILRVMCAWVGLVERMNALQDDAGSRKYKEVRGKMLADLKAAAKELEGKKNTGSLMERAGVKVLSDTILEMAARIDGTYSEQEHKYYYIDFLRGNYVLLDEDYLPDMRGKFEDFKELSLPNRILKHAKTNLMSFEEKLEDIFKNYGDDYGTAKLIIKYLEDTGRADSLEDYKNKLRESEEAAASDAKKKLGEFIENLELAQSYGQIEESREDKKEKIQKIANEWYEYAIRSRNYGFFNMVLEKYKEKIREDAKVRGAALQQELEQLCAKTGQTDCVRARIKKIGEMIDNQNYTVAEDLLSRINSDEADENFEVAGVDYLQKFIDEYEYNYKIVVGTDRSLSTLVSERTSDRTRNKDDRGARKLVDNWMSNGGLLGKSHLAALLAALGFVGANVEERSKIGKIENYFVQLARPEDGRKVNYKHPIAAFGSRAAEEGFRVVCLVGRYDADRLIEEFKNIGSRNNLVLLDHTLSLSDRRKLARKAKSDLYDKMFAVLDRVLLMFLVNNYNIQFVNQILMQVMMPFAYYQPYVWDSSKLMPPEIFMGRREELEKIESPEGVNIVYGGRQLGKSALLKMAKMDIDHDENHNRAVLVEIKGLDYRKAAKKVGHELYDADVLSEDIDTEDWDELARALKQRLMKGGAAQIPYLLLLLDEADVFIESCQKVNFHPFDALKDIQSAGMGRFKFVIAGLHNVVRFKRDLALSNNSVLTHLTSLTVKPFDKREARRLLEEPLYYLGFRFPEEKQSLVSLILANTNYFPGLIQLYCANLIGAMHKSDYAGYDQHNTPVYEIKENLIKKVLSDADFMSQIRQKFEITLRLGDDNLYYIIALLMAYLYHQNANSASESEGYGARDIIDAGEEYGIRKIMELNEGTVDGLLEELRELNILRQTVNHSYLFSRYSFFQMMGTAGEVEDKLMEYMED